MKVVIRAVALCSLGLGSAQAAPLVRDALAEGRLGLSAAAAFHLAAGDCPGCPTPPQALWYFRGDQVAVPTAGASGFERKLRAQADVRQWVAQRSYRPEGSLPPLVWVGSPQVARGVLAADGAALVGAQGAQQPFAVVPKIDTNLSYYNEASIRHFAGRAVKARGRLGEDGRFVARSLWPEDFAMDGASLPLKALAGQESLSLLVRSERGGAGQPPSRRLLWSRSGLPPQLADKPALAFILNGAQGDDDEAHGGHFAVASGRFGPRGEWDDWLVNNFYNLDSVSEKGIIAATLPMDAYQGDLNSGQSWYRPSYVLMAVFKDGRVPALYQEGIDRVFNHFYRHDFRYHHAAANCAGINLETLRSLGWNIPRQGPGSRLKAVAALPYMTVKEHSLNSGRKAYDYLVAEKTNLYPLVSFEAVGRDLLQRITAGKAATPFERMMAEDLEALVYVRLPQFPSSRDLGQAPVASLDEYMARVPADLKDWKIIPVAPRPFPENMKDKEAADEAPLPSDFAVAGYAGFLGILGVGGWKTKRHRKAGKQERAA